MLDIIGIRVIAVLEKGVMSTAVVGYHVAKASGIDRPPLAAVMHSIKLDGWQEGVLHPDLRRWWGAFEFGKALSMVCRDEFAIAVTPFWCCR